MHCGTKMGGFVCGDSRSRHARKCEFCHKRDGANQCDYPVGGKCKKCKGVGSRKPLERERLMEESFVNVIANDGQGKSAISVDKARDGLIHLQKSLVCHDCAGNGKAQCNRYFCGKACGVRVSEDEGYCPDHMERAGKTRPVILERCFWLEEAKHEGKCLRASCNTIVSVGDRCLYFPERRRVMDAECGEEFLRVAVRV